MGPFSQGYSKQDSRFKASLLGPAVTSIKAFLRTTSFPNMESSHGPMEDITRGSGGTTACMEKGCFAGRTGKDLKVVIRMTKKRGRGSFI